MCAVLTENLSTNCAHSDTDVCLADSFPELISQKTNKKRKTFKAANVNVQHFPTRLRHCDNQSLQSFKITIPILQSDSGFVEANIWLCKAR